MEEQLENFVVAVGKIRNASGHQGENERQSDRKMNKNTYDISSIKRVTRKFHVVVVQNNGKRYKCTKKCAACAKLLFC